MTSETDHKLECAREARHQAALLAPGKLRDALMEKVRIYESEVQAPVPIKVSLVD